MDAILKERAEARTAPSSISQQLRMPTLAFESMVKELADFSIPDKSMMTTLLKTDIMSRCMTGPDSISLSVAALKGVQKKLEGCTGFGSSVMMHASGRALAAGVNPKLLSDCGTFLEKMGFGMQALELSETGMVLYADAFGLDYFFLGILEGLAERVTKKEVIGDCSAPGTFSITF